MGKNIFFAHRRTMQLFPRRNSNLSGNLSLETFMKRNFLSAMFRLHLYFSCRQIRYGEVCCFSFFFLHRDCEKKFEKFGKTFFISFRIFEEDFKNSSSELSCTIRSGINYY